MYATSWRGRRPWRRRGVEAVEEGGELTLIAIRTGPHADLYGRRGHSRPLAYKTWFGCESLDEIQQIRIRGEPGRMNPNPLEPTEIGGFVEII